MKNMLLNEFKNIYGDNQNTSCFFAPGRVNLIGEHIDYNGGNVFPCAISIGTYAVCRLRNDNTLNLYSMNFPTKGIICKDLNSLDYNKDNDWANYPLGIIKTFKDSHYTIDKGMDILFFGNIPNGSGLSSSASIEVLTGYLLKNLFDLNMSNIEIAKLSQFSENTYNGVNCGIMDQFAVAMGKKDNAILINTANLHYRYYPLKNSVYKIIIMSTNKRRELNDSKYNERRSECEEALRRLQKINNISSLCDMTPESFDANVHLIGDNTLIKRAKHVVYENERTREAKEALTRNDLKTFGQLMTASHYSLRYDYEVTGKELDAIVDFALEEKGVLGARMTGAGFGGCAIALVSDDCIDEFIRHVREKYVKEIGYTADFYIASTSDGPTEIY